jgi:hypothetical protein
LPKTAKQDLNPDEMGRLEQVDPDESCLRLSRAGVEVAALDWIPNRRTLRGRLPEKVGGRDDCRLPLLSFTVDGQRRYFPRGPQCDFLRIAAVNGTAIWGRMGQLEGKRLSDARLHTLLFPCSFSLRRLQRRRITRLEDLRLRRGEGDGGNTTCLPNDLINRLADKKRREADKKPKDTVALSCFRSIFLTTDEMPEKHRLVFVLFDLACEAISGTAVTEDSLRAQREQSLPPMVVRSRRPASIGPDAYAALEHQMWDVVAGHLDSSPEQFETWFFGTKDGYVDQLSRRKLDIPGPLGDAPVISRPVARWHAQQHLYRSFHTISWLVHGQMLAVEPLIAPKLTDVERSYWELWYHAQPVLDGQSLIVQHHLNDLAFATTEAFAARSAGDADLQKMTENQLWAAFFQTVQWLWEITFQRRRADVNKKKAGPRTITFEEHMEPRIRDRRNGSDEESDYDFDEVESDDDF